MSLPNRARLALSAPDAAKLERIWNEHAAGVLGMLKTFCACLEDAQDVLQELFLRWVVQNLICIEIKDPIVLAFLIDVARSIRHDLAMLIVARIKFNCKYTKTLTG
jgi:hypothetical protein